MALKVQGFRYGCSLSKGVLLSIPLGATIWHRPYLTNCTHRSASCQRPCFSNLHNSVIAPESPVRPYSGRPQHMAPLAFTPHAPLEVFSLVLPTLCFIRYLSFACRKLIPQRAFNFSLLGMRQMLPWRVLFAIITVNIIGIWNISQHLLSFLSSPFKMQQLELQFAYLLTPGE